jgi:hypothetical protein
LKAKDFLLDLLSFSFFAFCFFTNDLFIVNLLFIPSPQIYVICGNSL